MLNFRLRILTKDRTWEATMEATTRALSIILLLDFSVESENTPLKNKQYQCGKIIAGRTRSQALLLHVKQ